MKRNPHLAQVSPNYLFPEIQRKKKAFLEKNPHAKLISLSIGDTSEPLPHEICDALTHYSRELATPHGYSGYGNEEGSKELRQTIAEQFYSGTIRADEIFISDGAKCDLGRLQHLFGSNLTVALPDPAYPVYLDGSKLAGVRTLISLPCVKENGFFPSLKNLEKLDLIYFCSPNNPTGAAATKEQLQALVACAQEHQAILIFDAAYASYIQATHLPKSIYEIEGAATCAIEVGSFSKMAGFSGVRLGWTVVPEKLTYECGKKVKDDFMRLITTLFNGASNLSQKGGLAALKAYPQLQKQIRFYLENAALLKKACLQAGYSVFGGEHAPYLWVTKDGCTSEDLFTHFLEKHHLVTTPGTGFGSYGEGYVRMSAFGSRATIEEAMLRCGATPRDSDARPK